ncbi:SDR family NAD(P)-dependent oxidoreductase [Pendulispora albinea]|uniref:SDR family NAD(P)-dependent oxidoreductase n=1 Tax=Pendulispora albinea TaxID=2741071 RepID=A0ABZ2LVL1_9BACT
MNGNFAPPAPWSNVSLMRPATIFITGASSGIGRALALEYVRKGAHVAIAARRAPELARVASEARAIAQKGGQIRVFPLDVREPRAVFETVQRAERELGSLDCVIANAGAGSYQHISTMSWDDVERAIDINIRGAIATILAAVPIMLSQQRGQLVGVSSLAGRRGMPYSAMYSASKSALSTFLESIRIELAPAGVKVTDVQPGFVDTSMVLTLKGRVPTPWMCSPQKAAHIMVRRLERAPAVIAFPWPLDVWSSIGRFLPTFMYDRLARLAAL